MKIKVLVAIMLLLFVGLTAERCGNTHLTNVTAIQEQAQTEENQSVLNQNQPAPRITWSMERDNLIKLKKLQNDRTINFFMYVFNEGIADPIGYYQVNKVSSVNSQLTNTMQLVTQWSTVGTGIGHCIDGAIPRPGARPWRPRRRS